MRWHLPAIRLLNVRQAAAKVLIECFDGLTCDKPLNETRNDMG
jgi:hypothetical protein